MYFHSTTCHWGHQPQIVKSFCSFEAPLDALPLCNSQVTTLLKHSHFHLQPTRRWCPILSDTGLSTVIQAFVTDYCSSYVVKKPGILEKLQLTKHSLWSPWQHRLLWEHHPAAPSFVLATSEDRVTFKVSAPILRAWHRFCLSHWRNSPFCINPRQLRHGGTSKLLTLRMGSVYAGDGISPESGCIEFLPGRVRTIVVAPALSTENSVFQHRPPSMNFLHPPTWGQNTTTHPHTHSLAHRKSLNKQIKL